MRHRGSYRKNREFSVLKIEINSTVSLRATVRHLVIVVVVVFHAYFSRSLIQRIDSIRLGSITLQATLDRNEITLNAVAVADAVSVLYNL